MKLGTTKRKLVCRKCNSHIGFITDIILESDYNGFIGNYTYCKECGEDV